MKIKQGTAWVAICEEYRNKFLDLMEFSESYWIGSDVGGILDCQCGEFTINMDDIRFIVDNDIPTDDVWRWYEYNTEAWIYGYPYINLVSWVRGAPRYDSTQKATIKLNKRKPAYRLIVWLQDKLSRIEERLRLRKK